MSNINNFTKHVKKSQFRILMTIEMKKEKSLGLKSIAGLRRHLKLCFSRSIGSPMIRRLKI